MINREKSNNDNEEDINPLWEEFIIPLETTIEIDSFK